MAKARRARHPSLVQGTFDLRIKVGNYPHICAAYGQPMADRLMGELVGRFLGAFGTDSTRAWGTARRQDENVIVASAWDERLVRPDEGMLSPQRLAHAVIAGMIAEPVEIGEHRIVPSIAAALLPSRRPEEAIEFTGSGFHLPPPGGMDWVRAFRADMEVAVEVLDALREGRLRLATQPVRDFYPDGQALYCECLLRGVAPDGTAYSGGRLIPALERVGIVRLVDQRVVDMVLDQLERFPGAHLGVNISCQSTVVDAWWWDAFERIAQKPDLGSRLVVEVRRGTSDPSAQLGAFARRIAMVGVRLAFDGFGVEDAAIGIHAPVRPDFIKLAPQLMADAERSKKGAATFQRIVDAAQELAPSVIAAGVETADQSRIAFESGVQWQQGYFVEGPSTVRAPAPCTDHRRSEPDVAVRRLRLVSGMEDA